jgi:hypothetical protein
MANPFLLTVLSAHRECKESPLYHGPLESIVYTLDVSVLGTDPASGVLTVIDLFDGEIVTGDVSGGSFNYGDAGSTRLRLPTLSDLTEHRQYRVKARFTIEGQVVEPWFRLICD